MRRICFFAEDIVFKLPQATATAAWLRGVIEREGYTLAQLNIIFCSDRYLHAHNYQYLRHDTLTDVLAFDYSAAPAPGISLDLHSTTAHYAQSEQHAHM